MSRWLLPGLLACWTAVLAQPAEPDAAGETPAQAEAAAAELADAVNEAPVEVDTGGAADGKEPEAEPDENEPEAEPDEEFTPDEEISEDYAVPLPSDI